MAEAPPHAGVLMTQAGTAPLPDSSPSPGGAADLDPHLLTELCQLAERAGGLERLRDAVDELIRQRTGR